jgi:hypothetical protein
VKTLAPVHPHSRLQEILSMKRLITIAGATAVVLALAACGSTAAGSTSSSSTTSSSNAAGGRGPGGLARRGAAGTLAQINGTSLILTDTTGTDVTVDYTNTTTITQTKTGVLADIVPGSCVVATGTKDASGTLVASSVRLSPPVNGACTAGLGNRPPGAGTRTPSGTPRATPAPGQPIPSFSAGKVTAVNGTSVTLQPTTGAAQTITVPTTVTVAESSAASPTDLSVGDCIQATGAKDSSGKVAATSLSIVPAGPSGCFTGGRGGFGGGFGGGGRGFGGGAPPAGAPTG